MYVRFKCECVLDTDSAATLVVRCPQHNEGIKDWSSDYQSPLRVVIHWRDGKAHFALHKVTYDERGFAVSMEHEAATPIYPTTAALAAEARRLGFDMQGVSDIFYDRYLEFLEFYPEEEADI